MGTAWAVGESATENALAAAVSASCAWHPLELVFLYLVVNQVCSPAKGWQTAGVGGTCGNKAFVKIGCGLKSVHFVSEMQSMICPVGGKRGLELISFWGSFLPKLG